MITKTIGDVEYECVLERIVIAANPSTGEFSTEATFQLQLNGVVVLLYPVTVAGIVSDVAELEVLI